MSLKDVVIVGMRDDPHLNFTTVTYADGSELVFINVDHHLNRLPPEVLLENAQRAKIARDDAAQRSIERQRERAAFVALD